MPVDFFTAKNNSQSCSYNGINLHSSYDPQKEAQRFASSISADFNPKAIIVTGPCLSYCADFLKEKFPGIPLYSVQYTHDFDCAKNKWKEQFVFSDNLAEDVFNTIGDEDLISTLFISWQPAANAFPETHNKTWELLKSAVLKSRNILNTRSYFSKRWIRNSVRFASLLKNKAEIIPANQTVIICASGPSLQSSIKKIKEYRDKVFLICVSSALAVLVENQIIPDLCISTDGGYWAKKHLSFHLKDHQEITLALPLEAALYGNFYSSNDVIPLSYGDGPSEDILNECGIKSFKALRNGTVSGTAANLALSITTEKVFFCGLDLSHSKGFVHSQPNELETADSTKDFRLKTKETRITPNSFENPALAIYKNWFSHASFNKRLFRLSNNFVYSNSLNNVPDVDWNYFASYIDGKKENKISIRHYDSKSLDASLIKKCIIKNMQNSEWIKNAFPVEHILYQRNKGTEKENETLIDLNEKTKTFYQNLMITMERQ